MTLIFLKSCLQREDDSDAAFLARHDSPEAEERKRFRNFVTYPPVRRGRPSRESESNTHDEFGACGSLAESHGSNSDLLVQIGDSRRRSGSTSRRFSFMEEQFSFEMIVEPFQPREFPLPEDTYEDMKREQISALKCKTKFRRARTVKVQDDLATEFVSGDFDEPPEELPFVPPSPEYSGSTDSNVDDFNDPEWNETSSERRMSVSKNSKR